MKVNIKLLDNRTDKYPKKVNRNDAGIDLWATRVHEDVTIKEMERHLLLGTGVAVEIPSGYVGLLIPRSSITKKYWRMTNSIGVIDSDYRGEIMIPLYGKEGLAYYDTLFDKPIVQLVCVPCLLDYEIVEKFDNEVTARGAGGFGSTDKLS